MKKTTSFHLEQDILSEIEEYKKVHNLSSRNIALERMLLERRFLINMPTIKNTDAATTPVKAEKKEEKKKTFIGSSVENSFNTMPD